MKTRSIIAVSMLAGAVVGGAAIQALHAQAKPPVYMIAINEVSDQERYAKEYVSPAQKSVKDHGGEYLAAGPGTRVAGNLPDGAGCDPSLGKHGGATSVAQFSRISGCTEDWREVREI